MRANRFTALCVDPLLTATFAPDEEKSPPARQARQWHSGIPINRNVCAHRYGPFARITRPLRGVSSDSQISSSEIQGSAIGW